MDWKINKIVKNDSAYYTINWSPFQKAEKYQILISVPAISGIAELYFMDRSKKLNRFYLSSSYYGGLRSTLREYTDSELVQNQWHKNILEKWSNNIWYRWSHTESLQDMNDILFFLRSSTWWKSKKIESSGRYKYIYLIEKNAGNLITI